MTLELVSLICFIALTLATATGFMVIRDLATPGSVLARRSITGGAIRGLRRPHTVFDEAPARSVTGRIDQAFDRLVLESGHQTSPVAFLLLLIASGLLVAGNLWLTFDNELAAIGGMLMGMVIPLVVISLHRARRLRKVREELPRVLDLWARAVRAGESLDQAVALVASESSGVLGKEFKQCSHQLEMGLAVPIVMKSLAARISVLELRMLATTLAVHRQTGGNLAETLERMSSVVRDRLNAYRQMRATTGAGRASAMLIATISPVAYVIMFLWQPDHFSILYEDPLGLTLLTLAFVLEVVGIFWVIGLLRSDR
jgi:tight adherence protein B